MDRLHHTLATLHLQSKSDPRPIRVFREFLSHLDRLTPRQPPRNKAAVLRKSRRGKR